MDIGRPVTYLQEQIEHCFMDISTAKAEAITRTGLPHRHTNTHPSTQPLTWQHDIESLAHRKQVDGSTVR